MSDPLVDTIAAHYLEDWSETCKGETFASCSCVKHLGGGIEVWASHVAEEIRKAHSVKSEWGIQRSEPYGGVIPLWSMGEAIEYRDNWNPPGATGHALLVYREILTAPWLPVPEEKP